MMAASENISTLDDYGRRHHQQQLNAAEPFYELIKQPVYMVVVYTLAYSAVFLLAVIGNVLVICVVLVNVLVICVVCRNSSMHNVTNYFIVNLAVAMTTVAMTTWPSPTCSSACSVCQSPSSPTSSQVRIHHL